jgi:hypothetical protein
MNQDTTTEQVTENYTELYEILTTLGRIETELNELEKTFKRKPSFIPKPLPDSTSSTQTVTD